MNKMKQFLIQEDGATAIEYGLIVALVSLAVIVGLNALGPVLGETFTFIATEVEGATAGQGG